MCFINLFSVDVQTRVRMIVYHLCALFLLSGVFGVDADEVKSVSVMEGHSVTLHTDLTHIQYDRILWMFEFHDTVIAEIHAQNVNMYDSNEIFGGRLKLDSQTGSLTITDIRITDSGVYTLETIRDRRSSYKRFKVTVYFTQQSTEVQIILLPVVLIVCLLMGCMCCCCCVCCLCCRKRTGPESYNILIISHLTSSLCFCTTDTDAAGNKGEMWTCVFLVCVTGVFGVDADEVKSVSVMEGDSVTLHTDFTHIQENDRILWIFGPEDTPIAEIHKKSIDMYDSKEIFGDRLKLDSQTGSLNITNIRITDSSVFTLEIISDRGTSYKRFNVTVYGFPPFLSALRTRQSTEVHTILVLVVVIVFLLMGWMCCCCYETLRDEKNMSEYTEVIYSLHVMEGDSVTLHTNVTHIQTQDQILWMLESEETH
ncbi:uncharacterized protein LOC130429892 [Triplophysa dalaica]|uniref:uncharacterized protein LOC130429892 n=1 Tax=Triplophysa dalaica TaxID=1582913 RepID=UPI0024E01E92|nr:uncharacterized protein LOC130429892 [Triplophysa dalaica]